jgi:hypothetical protein
MLAKIGRIIAKIYIAMFLYVSAVSLYDGFKQDQYEKFFLVILGAGLPLIIYFWVGIIKATLRNYLKTFAGYNAEDLNIMSYDELNKRRDLYRLNNNVDHTQTPKNQLGMAIKQAKEELKAQPGLVGGFVEGYKSATEGTKGFHGTYGKRIVCINCGERMSKHIGIWSTSIKCKDNDRKCVPLEAPDV